MFSACEKTRNKTIRIPRRGLNVLIFDLVIIAELNNARYYFFYGFLYMDI
jgi:hypothetical protein